MTGPGVRALIDAGSLSDMADMPLSAASLPVSASTRDPARRPAAGRAPAAGCRNAAAAGAGPGPPRFRVGPGPGPGPAESRAEPAGGGGAKFNSSYPGPGLWRPPTQTPSAEPECLGPGLVTWTTLSQAPSHSVAVPVTRTTVTSS